MFSVYQGVDNYDDVLKEIKDNKPTHVISFIEKIHGQSLVGIYVILTKWSLERTNF